MGFTTSIFASCGQIQFLIVLIDMYVNGLEIICALIFISFEGILSYPAEAFVFNFLIISSISYSDASLILKGLI